MKIKKKEKMGEGRAAGPLKNILHIEKIP